MMNLLIQSVRLMQPGKDADKQVADILITNGVIEKIGTGIKAGKDVEVFDAKGAMASIGWIDMKANFRDPGDEIKEGILSGLEAAAAGGFTGVVLMPSTKPAIQSKADVQYIKNRSRHHLVTLYPTGSLSVDREGKDITEMFDMGQAGAVAFTDDKKPVSDSGLMLRAMQYAANAGSFIISFPDDKNISGKGQVNEGIASTIAGLKGMPAFAEELMISRDLKICSYTGGRIHFSTISTARSVELIREAKRNGLHVTAEVCAHQLVFDDSVILDYDTNYKVKPPFRSLHDVETLKHAITDGTIDTICSDHTPEDPESKVVEFDFAAFGISGIETAFAAAHTGSNGEVPLSRLIDAFTVQPRKILRLPIEPIKEGVHANITIFDPELKWTPTQLKSRSKNNPFLGKQLRGKPLAVAANGKFMIIS